jgi:putative DNA primase/helicase
MEENVLASPISAFVSECCTTGAADSVAVSNLYSAYGKWCEDNGWERKSTVQSFGKDLRAVVSGISDKRPGENRSDQIDPARKRVYYGIGLRPGF